MSAGIFAGGVLGPGQPVQQASPAHVHKRQFENAGLRTFWERRNGPLAIAGAAWLPQQAGGDEAATGH
jgi:hypothetical protein